MTNFIGITAALPAQAIELGTAPEESQRSVQLMQSIPAIPGRETTAQDSPSTARRPHRRTGPRTHIAPAQTPAKVGFPKPECADPLPVLRTLPFDVPDELRRADRHGLLRFRQLASVHIDDSGGDRIRSATRTVKNSQFRFSKSGATGGDLVDGPGSVIVEVSVAGSREGNARARGSSRGSRGGLPG